MVLFEISLSAGCSAVGNDARTRATGAQCEDDLNDYNSARLCVHPCGRGCWTLDLDLGPTVHGPPSSRRCNDFTTSPSDGKSIIDDVKQ